VNKLAHRVFFGAALAAVAGAVALAWLPAGQVGPALFADGLGALSEADPSGEGPPAGRGASGCCPGRLMQDSYAEQAGGGAPRPGL
jgi:hypothetical protein